MIHQTECLPWTEHGVQNLQKYTISFARVLPLRLLLHYFFIIIICSVRRQRRRGDRRRPVEVAKAVVYVSRRISSPFVRFPSFNNNRPTAKTTPRVHIPLSFSSVYSLCTYIYIYTYIP